MADVCEGMKAEGPARELLGWFARERRDLPWRRTSDPYRLWVAEIMLAQTQVATVIPYYERFLGLFPTVRALAGAPLDGVLKAWEGLGYYARARNLHRAARVVVERYGGRLPNDPRALRSLPGVGEYTAGALASMAFGRDEIALDGNVRRVLARLFRLAEPTPAELRRRAASILPHGQAGALNQALMDLGSAVCTPRRPRCEGCPLRAHCEAYRQGVQEQIPARRPRPPVPHADVCAALIRRDGHLLIAQRPPEGLLGGLWEFPGGKREPGEGLEACLQREIREELGVDVEVGERVTSVEHAYTHLRITLHAFHCRLVAGEPQAIACSAFRWVRPPDLRRYAFSAADLKVIAALAP